MIHSCKNQQKYQSCIRGFECFTFTSSFTSGWRDDQRAAPSLLQAFVQSGHAESCGVDVCRADGGEAVTGLTAVVLDLQHAQLLVGEVRANLAEVGHNYEPVGYGQKNHVGRLQESRDAQRLETIKGLKLRKSKMNKTFLD